MSAPVTVMDVPRLDVVVAEQDGVIARRQAIACGCTPADVRRLIRRRELVVVYPGIYVNHTGPLTWRQRAWAAVLDAEPAALCHESALPDAAGSVIHIAVDSDRKVTTRPGVRVHRRPRLIDDVAWHVRPPRVRIHDTVIDLADGARTEMEAVAALTDAVGARITTAAHLLEAVDGRKRMRRRRFLIGVLRDIAQGTCSVLEHRYLVDVERAHGLPTPTRQSPTQVGRTGFRDLEYRDHRVVVELDGWRFHDDAAARDRDLQRDFDAAVDAELTTFRLGLGQATVRACATARQIGRALAERGWSGQIHPCPRCAE